MLLIEAGLSKNESITQMLKIFSQDNSHISLHIKISCKGDILPQKWSVAVARIVLEYGQAVN